MQQVEDLRPTDARASPVTHGVYRKIVMRTVPLLFLCYVLNYIDRVNISFASLQFRQDLGISVASYGFGVGIFFIGYVLFEVPSNLLMQRIGARRTIMRIMVMWGDRLDRHDVRPVRDAALYRPRAARALPRRGSFPVSSST